MKILLNVHLILLMTLGLIACGGSGGPNLTEPSPSPTPNPISTPSPAPEPTPEPSPTGSPEPTPVPSPTPTNNPEPTPSPTNTPAPAPIEDQCNTTAECRAEYGDTATDCQNSNSNQSICMCGAQACSASPFPTPSPSPLPSPPALSGCEIKGTLEKWHRVELLCNGPNASEDDGKTFTDYRFNVEFNQGNLSYLVPGHFAADGNAKDSSASSGTKWRAYFSAPTTGEWQYRISFREGENVAMADDVNAGTALAPYDDEQGNFVVNAFTASGAGLTERGLLALKNDERYMRFSEDDKVFIQGGMDSPENIFGYDEFDNTTKFNNKGSCKGILHSFDAHENDWNSGDPTWGNQQGKSLIGLLNYISAKGVNSVYVMAMTVDGDGCDAHPWVDYSGDRKAFDVSKLDQWEIAFSHMNEKGLLIHFMTQETENDQLLDGGALGNQRKLYYREMISRFAHHTALQWNLGEENTNTVAQQKAFADYIKQIDPYQHPVFMHTFPGERDKYEDLLGHQSFDGPTLQFGNIPASATGGLYGETVKWLNESKSAGKAWVVTATEASGGNAPTPVTNATAHQRIYWMWANIMAGGAGFEWYLKRDGQGHAYDLAVEDLREFDALWTETGHVVAFFNHIVTQNFGLDLQAFAPQNNVTSINSDWVLADPGRAYILFLREGGSTDINLSTGDDYQVHWFNPRTGQLSTGDLISGAGNQNIGTPPSQASNDWAALVINTNLGVAIHPDIVSVESIDPNTIIKTPQANWKDSYSVGERCYCDSNFDHGIGTQMVNTNAGTMTVRDACDLIGDGPGSAGRPAYNDIQCGNGPANDQDDEDYCPGRIDLGKEGCGHIGPVWILPDSTSEETYVEENGLIIMEAENTLSDLDQWFNASTVNGYTGTGYIEFDGNNAQSGPARSPLEYKLQVTTGGLYYLHMRLARETLVINGETRNDVANDGYVRLEGDVEAGPNVGNTHGDHASENTLTSNTKFFGGSNLEFSWASGNRLDLGGHNNKRVAIYRLKAGEQYTFVLSGRSKHFKVDRIVFRHESKSAGEAQDINKGETRP